MQNTINNAVRAFYNTSPKEVRALGGGFYGRAFLISLDREPFSVVLKLYLFPGFAAGEAEQLETLAKYALLKMPKVYKVIEKEQAELDFDVLFMEYIEGINAGCEDISQMTEDVRDGICESIVDNLLAYHGVVNPKGFGPLSGKEYFSTWQEYYRPIAEAVVDKAKLLKAAGQITDYTLDVFEKSIDKFDSVFYLPITEARLIHGDYNTWNIMLDRDKKRAVAAIDPFNCCFADSEFDLYQLDNANGKGYGLLERYAEKALLSENFEAKRRFYELYTEVNHYYDSKVTVNTEAVEKLARKLEEIM